MAITKMIQTVKSHLKSKWFVCRITSGKKSARYGIRFSYPLFIALVALGIVLENPYLLLATALIALLGVILPMHPFDYLYNYCVAPLMGTEKIPGRGSELQINSAIALCFTVAVTASILYALHLHYGVMALLYVISSIFFITVQARTEDFSIESLHRFLFNRSR